MMYIESPEIVYLYKWNFVSFSQNLTFPIPSPWKPLSIMPLGPSILSQMEGFPSFSWLSNILFYKEIQR